MALQRDRPRFSLNSASSGIDKANQAAQRSFRSTVVVGNATSWTHFHQKRPFRFNRLLFVQFAELERAASSYISPIIQNLSGPASSCSVLWSAATLVHWSLQISKARFSSSKSSNWLPRVPPQLSRRAAWILHGPSSHRFYFSWQTSVEQPRKQRI